MNHELQQLTVKYAIDGPDRRMLRLRFGLACANRVRHLLEEPRAIELLDVLQSYVDGHCGEATLENAATEAAHVANHHRGSASIDGTKHSAVSATYAVANALAGRALDAAEYAAYSTVYGYGGYAVSDPDSFTPEYTWQTRMLQQLFEEEHAAH